jgi:branched-chain amino acid transport system ATP-binding protein
VTADRGDAPILRTEHLSVHFGGLAALNRVSLAVSAGEIRAIIGPNGAGKSTFFNCVTGVLRPTAGRVLFDGADITGLPPHVISKKAIARSYQITNILPGATVLENVRIAAQSRHHAWGLLRHHRAYADVLARARAVLAAVLCLDEPTAGMSVVETHATVELIRRIARDLTILIVEHDMEVVMGLARVITVLHYGEVLAEGTPAEIQANPRVQEVYLKT